MTAESDVRPVGLYFHLPFCRARCSYCTFAISTRLERKGPFLAALEREIDRRADSPAGAATVDTIHLGGGTPTLLSDRELDRLLELVRRRFRIDARAEIAIEANPDDLPPGRSKRLQELGFDRISIGAQSFDDRELEALDRIHDGDAARRCLDEAAAVPGLRVGVDLMLGIPLQGPESFARSVSRALASGAGHVSIYFLETDGPSKLAREIAAGRVEVPGDDRAAAIFLEAVGALRAAGLFRYETSNFCRPGEEAKGNLRYWRREPYLGLGPSAHSLVGEERFRNAASLPDYLRRMKDDGLAEVERKSVEPDERLREEIFLGLREAAGVPRERIELAGRRLDRPALLSKLDEGIALGELEEREGRIFFSDEGFLRMNLYLEELF